MKRSDSNNNRTGIKMDSPTPRTKPTITLRRHSTSPSSAGRAVIASVSGVANRQTSAPSMKSNPYVGWFRHSPSTAPRVRISKKSSWCTRVSTSLPSYKNSPHIGWFRHAPPSCLDISLTNQSAPVLSVEEKDLLWKILQELNQEGIQRDGSLVVSGYLRGGGKDVMERSRSRRALVKNLQASSAEGTMSTVNLLSSLASWFLFPVAYDAESCGYLKERYATTSKRRRSKTKRKDNDDSVLSQLLSPYLPSFLEEPPRALTQDQYPKYVGGSKGSGEAGDDDSFSSSDSDSMEQTSANPSKPQGDLSLSVSSLAEAYYAHQTTTKELTERVHPSTSFSSTVSPHRLDYVITQMDIARMTRNASRHLDVQSILSLPVTTYQKGVSAASSSSKARGDGWSWTIVEESESASDHGPTSSIQEEVDFCVICLDHFVDGDRLRVLPCDHSFHVGCIDRWLSGSQSFEECYTSGCPTCKKRPTLGSKPRAQSMCEPTSHNEREGKHRSGSLDGSVPSWAFAQIGSALVAQDQGISICSEISPSS